MIPFLNFFLWLVKISDKSAPPPLSNCYRDTTAHFELKLASFLIKLMFYIMPIGGNEILLNEDCKGPSKESPYQSALRCSHTFHLSHKLTFSHNDT